MFGWSQQATLQFHCLPCPGHWKPWLPTWYCRWDHAGSHRPVPARHSFHFSEECQYCCLSWRQEKLTGIIPTRYSDSMFKSCMCTHCFSSFAILHTIVIAFFVKIGVCFRWLAVLFLFFFFSKILYIHTFCYASKNYKMSVRNTLKLIFYWF